MTSTGRAVLVEEVSESQDGSTGSSEQSDHIANERTTPPTQIRGRGQPVIPVLPVGWGRPYAADAGLNGISVHPPMQAPMIAPNAEGLTNAAWHRDARHQRSIGQGSRGQRTVHGGESTVLARYGHDRTRNSYDGELLF